MRVLSSLLERFKKSLGQDTTNKNLIALIIESSTNIKTKPEEINIREFTLEITTSPIKKSEIKMKENFILSEIRAQTKQNISRILYK